MIVQLENVFKDYIQGKEPVHVLRDISMTVDEGEYIAIMGPSGSGKTTLMNLLGCLDVPTSGTYLLEGQDIGSLSDDWLRISATSPSALCYRISICCPR